jgi:hypothetical protein
VRDVDVEVLDVRVDDVLLGNADDGLEARNGTLTGAGAAGRSAGLPKAELMFLCPTRAASTI